MNKKYFLLLLIIISLCQCLPISEEKQLTEVNIDFELPLFQQLYNFQDQQLMDSLYRFFHHKDPSYRYAAALAFASTPDPKAIDSLSFLLYDDVENVRVAAAYAIGQIKEESGEEILVDAFVQEDSTAEYAHLNATILEAIGKCGTQKMLQFMSTTQSYLRADSLLVEGQARGIYRYALRSIVVPEGTQKMVEILTKPGYTNKAKLIAANYLYRAKNIELDTLAGQLSSVLFRERDPLIKIPLAIALSKTKDPEAFNALQRMYRTEKDYRVKCSILRALGNFDYRLVQELAYSALNDENLKVANTAASYFVNHGLPNDASVYWRKAKDSLAWPVELKMYSAANKHMENYFEDYKRMINRELRARYDNSSNPYLKAGCLEALGEYPWNWKVIREAMFNTGVPVIKTAGINAIGKITKTKEFARSRTLRFEVANIIRSVMETGDPGLMAEAATIIADQSVIMIDNFEEQSFLVQAMNKLKLPRDIETYNAIQTAIDRLNGKTETEKKTVEYNHEIDWRRVNTISDNAKAVVKTDKGNFEIKLFKNQTPGTVANFVQLAKEGFYDDKNFHRVIPGFVAQGGCTRGDGYGSLNYTLRSELGLQYFDDEGYVGMASAGNHTECNQWFVTYAPTFHLDGNYTIFGKVIKGMDVVHNLEIGDEITTINIQ